MIKSKNKFYLLVSSISFFVFGSSSQAGNINIPEENLFYPHRLATKANLYYDADSKEFTALLDGKQKKINKYDVYGIPSNLPENKIENFLKVARFSLNKVGEDYSLKVNLRINGGMKKTSTALDKASKVQTAVWVADTALSASGHRTTGEWIAQSNHRTPSEWLSQGNHRTPLEWLSGAPSKNSPNAKK